ncbi:Uncharacterized protein Rs2_29002 [Raphanus sativus]|nr:Uncharacterized protein Rs2_29002 [Raphanus sativus]
MADREAYTRMAVAIARAMEATNDYAAQMEKCRTGGRSYNVRAKLSKKKEETAAEVMLQEVRARIEVLSEYKDGRFEIDDELKRLRRREIECEVDYSAAAVSDPSLSRIGLPQISDDSINQAPDDAGLHFSPRSFMSRAQENLQSKQNNAVAIVVVTYLHLHLLSIRNSKVGFRKRTASLRKVCDRDSRWSLSRAR